LAIAGKLSKRENMARLGGVIAVLTDEQNRRFASVLTKACLQRTAETPAMATSASTGSPIRAIELAGLPGTGKSTVARCLESILRDAGMPIRSRPVVLADQSWFMRRQQVRLQLIARNVARCGRLYRRAFDLIASSGQRSVMDFAVVMSNFWSIIALMTEGQAAEDLLTIADQGLLQAIWSVQLSSSRELPLDAWRPLLLAAGLGSTLLVHVQSDIGVSRQRVSTRGRSRTRLDPERFQERSRQWQIAAENMNKLIEWAARIMPYDQHGGRVLSVVNREGAPEAAAAEVAAAYLRRGDLRACA
jgi:hypothetical protein